MSNTFRTNAKGDIAQKADKSLISTGAFNNEFYSYTVSLNSSFQKVGTFSLVTGATSGTCPIGRVLHLTGRKLIPSVNPMTNFPTGTPLETTGPTFLVSVYDPISFLTGFVDPSSNTFANFDQNLPNFFDNGTAASGVLPPLGGVGTIIPGRTILVTGIVTVSLPGVTTASNALVSLMTPDGDVDLTVNYRAICGNGGIEITALLADGTINIADESTITYVVFN